MVRALNLDGMFIPVPFPEIEFKNFKFAGGESHIKLNNNIDYTKIEKVIITHRIRSGDDIILIMIAQDALKIKGIENFDLIFPYLPYARQDRLCDDGESITLKVFTNLINSLNFKKVIILDAHSNVGPVLLDRCVNKGISNYVNDAAIDIYWEHDSSDLILISPDDGANLKVEKLFKSVLSPDGSNVFHSIVKCNKNRDPKTGELLGFEVLFDGDLKGRPCLIVDDICDGGRTFSGTAKELKKKNAGDIYLFVTFGIFSYGFDELSKHIKKIYTTNGFSDIDNPIVKQFKIQL
jgi:ribose-phosphate pyrophosphokinase